MEKQYSIKASYKTNTYIIKGYFPTEDAFKQEIVNRKIHNLNKQSSFYIEYPSGIQSIQQAYKDCEKYNKNTFKVNIQKKKKQKNQSISQKDSQNSSQIIKHLSFADSIAPQIQPFNTQNYRHSLNLQQGNERSEQPQFQSVISKTVPKRQKRRKASQDLELQNQLSHQQPVTQFGLNNFEESRSSSLHNEHELPIFQVSEILQKPPLQQQQKQRPTTGSNQINQPKLNSKQRVLSMETNYTYKFDPSDSSKTCTSCSKVNFHAENICSNCHEERQTKKIQKISKQLNETLKAKIKQEVQFDLNAKIQRIKIQLKNQISQLKLKNDQQHEQILTISEQNKELKGSLRAQQNKTKSLETQLNKIKLQFQVYTDKINLFEKDFQTINIINFQLQNSKIILQHKIDELAQKQLKSSKDSEAMIQKIRSSNEIKKEERQKIIQRPIFPEQKPAPQNMKNRNPLVHQPKTEEKKVQNSISKEQLKQMFMNPKFPEEGKGQNEVDRKGLKPIDGSIKQVKKISILKVGQSYQPQINIKNTGSSKWPSEVFIFEKDTKRTKKIESLSPNQEIVFKDDTVYKAQREGQNIQIKYQVYYEQNGEKTYIGLPVSIFIKVKKAQSDSILADLSEDEQAERQMSGFGSGKIDQQELERSRVQVEGYGKQIMGEVQSELKRYHGFVKMINEKKREMDVGNQTTKSIKSQLESMGITEQNFRECDAEVIDEVIKSLKVIDIIRA